MFVFDPKQDEYADLKSRKTFAIIHAQTRFNRPLTTTTPLLRLLCELPGLLYLDFRPISSRLLLMLRRTLLQLVLRTQEAFLQRAPTPLET